MTRHLRTGQDYRVIAETIKDTLITATVQSDVARVARRLAEAFKDNRGEFRFDTFYAACGLDEWGRVKVEDEDLGLSRS
jgi:hypothetical protein